MKRRTFIKNASLASGMLLAPQFLTAFSQNELFSSTGKKVVVIQLSGGNDGLNTIVPFRNDIYYKNRSFLAQKASSLFKLTDELGLHESLKNHKSLYDDGDLCMVNSVGYPNPNRSHFRATDIWHTGSHADEILQTGWIGRYLDTKKSKSFNAIEIDDSLSLLMKGKNINGIATKNAKLFYQTTQEPFFKKIAAHYETDHLSEHNLGYLYKTMIDAKSSSKYIYETSKTYNSSVIYPGNAFGKQLKTVAEFINSGLSTEMYYVSLGGFDTHANQPAKQKRLLKVYDEGLAAFVKDLKENDTFKDTLIMVFSEFGRRVKQNAANGTDHGTANNVFLIGANLKTQGMYNNAPNLSQLDKNGDLNFEIDFRTIYASILNDWLAVDSQRVLNASFPRLNVF